MKDENAKPGSRDWLLTNPSKNGAIEGYANVVSAQRGDSVSLYVSTTASSYTVQLFRMGFYSGAQGRLVWTSSPQTGEVQAAPTVAPATNMVEASWKASLTVPIDPAWPPGDYLFKLAGSNGYQTYVPLTVRDDDSTAGLLIQNSVTTWQAYNLWGGYDLYSGGPTESATRRAKVVSFDRPYKIGDGSGDFLGNELPFVSLVESLGFDVSYTTDVDLDLHPERVLQHHALVSLGHDEYWSLAMRDGAEAARDHGVNLLFLGANAIFRHIRLEPSLLGPDRHEVNYRVAGEDPLFGVDNADVTVSWRDPPVSRPENTLLGELYQCNPVHADFVVAESNSWVFDGTGLTRGSKLKGLVGSEYDGYNPRFKGPANVEIMGHSPLRCRDIAGYSDFTYYVAPSQAGVVDTGTNNWVPKMSDPALAVAVDRITQNVLAVFAEGPAGLVHPSTSNYATLPKGSFPPPHNTINENGAPTTTVRRSATTSAPVTTAPPTSQTAPATTSAPTTNAPTTSPPPTSPPTTSPPTTSAPTTQTTA